MFLNDRNFDIVDELEKIAIDAGVSLLHLAMGGLAAQPMVASVIAGATTPDQVRANVEAGSWEPPADVLAAIDAVTKPSS
jgi:aryl-alcohol dehydrogenase-like predicted oxidoreductase